MANYVNVTQKEMEEFLSPQDFHLVDPRKSNPGDRTVELLYGKRVDVDGVQLTLRVCSGINPGGASREVGKDAIRCVVFARTEDGKVYKMPDGGSKRVHRVVNWRKNLASRIAKLEDPAFLATLVALHVQVENVVCTKCGAKMRPRSGKNGVFLGCSEYPKCNGTKQVKSDN